MRQLTEEDIQKIAKELGIEPTPGFSEKIVDIADNHFIQKKYWKNREQNADARADLKKISKAMDPIDWTA
jgi:glutaredoxin-related protein